ASLRRATIAGLRLLHFDRADPRLDRANRIMSVANYALAAVRKGQIGVRGKKRIEFDLNRPCNQPTSAGSQNFGERIIDFVFLSERDDAILVHGVTLLLGDSRGLVTNPVTPPSPPRHPVSSIAPDEADATAWRSAGSTPHRNREPAQDDPLETMRSVWIARRLHRRPRSPCSTPLSGCR